MSEPFKSKVEINETVAEYHEPAPLQAGEREDSDKITPTPDYALSKEQRSLDIWEGEHKKKYVVEYFEIPNLIEDFSTKMEVAKIDKYIKNALEKRGYEKNIENYAHILREFEKEIGSERMEFYKRVRKITEAMAIETKISKLNEMRGLLRHGKLLG